MLSPAPAKATPREQMHVQVRHRLTCIFAVVDHEAEAFVR